MNSIRSRLLLSLLAALVLAAGVMAVWTYRNVLAETEALFDYQLRQMAFSLRDQGEIAPEQASTLADQDIDFVVQVWTVDGRSIYASRPHSALPAHALLGFADVAVDGSGTWRTFSVATPTRVIQVAQPAQVRSRLATDAALRSVAPMLWLAPLLALVMGGVVSLALRPLRRLAADVGQRNAQSLAPLPSAGLPDEVSPLVKALNDLLLRMNQSLDTQQAFVADAAHELRSPLTALKLQLHLLQRADDEVVRRDAVAALASGVERVTRLVEQLLAMARAEPGAATNTLRSVDLGGLAREAIADTVPLSVSRGIRLELLADQPVSVQGDPSALSALVRNLADNAVRYAPPGSRVEVSVALDQGQAELRIDDAGPGIPAAERERVFDRFYRRAVSDATGSGLGLAIVRSVASRHGAQVALGESPLGGLRVTVRFPPTAQAVSEGT